MSIQFGATCFFNTPNEFSLVVDVTKQFPLIQYVEFRGERPFLFPDITPKNEIRNYKEILKKAGLKNTLHTTMYDVNLATLNPWIKDANIECYKKYLDLAEYLESQVVVVHGGFLFEEFTNSPLKDEFVDIAEKYLCESLSELADYGKRRGVKIALENSPPKKKGVRIVHNAETQIKILQKVNHHNLGALLDFAHAHLFRLDLLDYLQKIKPYLFEIHAHNNFGQYDEHLGLSKGDIDYRPILKSNGANDLPFIMEIGSYESVLETLKWLQKMGF
jgi:sugar phosphate isomerase/epimerase